jgi:hypothetical protein
MKIFTQEKNTTADGSITLFATTNNYVADSVSVLMIENETVTSPAFNELGANFIEMVAPPTGLLVFTYQYEDADIVNVNTIVPGLSPWDSTKILRLINLIKLMQTNIETLEVALGNRVAKQEFNSWSAEIQKSIDELKLLLG